MRSSPAWVQARWRREGPPPAAKKRLGVRNISLHRLLETFTVDASSRLSAEAAGGAEMPFELTEERGTGRVPLYCYTPLTGEFIESRMGLLATLPSYGPDVAENRAGSATLPATTIMSSRTFCL